VETDEGGVVEAVEPEAGLVLDRLGVARQRCVELRLAGELPAVGGALELGAREIRAGGGEPVVAPPELVEAPLREAAAEDPAAGGDLAQRVRVVDARSQLAAQLVDALRARQRFHRVTSADGVRLGSPAPAFATSNPSAHSRRGARGAAGESAAQSRRSDRQESPIERETPMRRAEECASESWPGASRLRSPVWICDERRRVVFANRAAQECLGLGEDRWLGGPCHELVAGRERTGAAFCRADCALFRSALQGGELAPVQFQVGGGRTKRWLKVIPFVTQGPGGEPRIVHVADETGRERRACEFLDGVRRNAPPNPRAAASAVPPITPREHEILALLAQGMHSKGVARALGIRYVTVRNHVQDLLARLRVHSILEAIALLVGGDGAGDDL
jgi:DNA-binding CsgD family transcriptional regulator/PAS domain-containing protein